MFVLIESENKTKNGKFSRKNKWICKFFFKHCFFLNILLLLLIYKAIVSSSTTREKNKQINSFGNFPRENNNRQWSFWNNSDDDDDDEKVKANRKFEYIAVIWSTSIFNNKQQTTENSTRQFIIDSFIDEWKKKSHLNKSFTGFIYLFIYHNSMNWCSCLWI